VTPKGSSKLIWFHAASIGEFKSIIPIINQLNLNHQNFKFLITTNTLSSANLAKTELKKIKNTEHRYMPYDVPYLIDRFLYLWKPDKIFLVDSEIWPNLILKAYNYKIPIALINARLTFKSFKRWMIFSKLAQKIFSKINLFLCSNYETKTKLEQLNLKNIYFEGNIKLSDHIDEEKIKNFNENTLLKKRFWFAASTHKDEDLFCLETHMKLKGKFDDVITIIAPRHIERSNEINSLAKDLGLNPQILNENENIQENKEIIIINYFGALKSFFKYTKSVFMGKSMIFKLKDDGGQNPIEAAKMGCKIYHGPYVYNFEEIYEILKNNNVSKQIKDHKELSEHLALDLVTPIKQSNNDKEIINNLGQETLNKTIAIINNFINYEFN
jgi:3-deoxy-D-manno-octulosonic-acid transferase